MVRILNIKPMYPNLQYIEAAGLSTDTKPTDNLVTGSVFIEVDTGDAFLFDEVSGVWKKV